MEKFESAEDIIEDSSMSREEALLNVNPECPPEILERQTLIDLEYYSFDGKLHKGQLLIDKRLASDVKEIFQIIKEHTFPIESVTPLSDERFTKNGVWDDDLSMKANNTSAFNYRTITGTDRLSNHAEGFALDINPRLNPFIKGETVLPEDAAYVPAQPGTLTEDHPVVQAFIERGWTWGGNWESLKDYQHFEKNPEQ